jgi:predicted ATPase
MLIGMVAGGRSPRFVGRDEQVRRLDAAMDRARGDAATLMLVGGEAGVAKTRLVEEWCGRVRSDGGRVLTGSCLDLADGTLPYRPVAEALRGLGDQVGLTALRRLRRLPPRRGDARGWLT